MRDRHSGEFWTLLVENLKCKSLLCDFDTSVVYEIVAYDMGKLSVCSRCVYLMSWSLVRLQVVTCTLTSGHITVYDI